MLEEVRNELRRQLEEVEKRIDELKERLEKGG